MLGWMCCDCYEYETKKEHVRKLMTDQANFELQFLLHGVCRKNEGRMSRVRGVSLYFIVAANVGLRESNIIKIP